MPRILHVDEVIGQAYDCVLDPNGWGNVLASYAEFVGGESALIYVKPRSGSTFGRVVTSAGFDSNYSLGGYLSYYEARSPLIPRYRKLPAGQVRALGDYAFSAAYRETEYYRDWVRPQGIADVLGSHLLRTPQLYAWMSVRREESRGTYSTREIRLANRIAGHIGRAIKLRSQFESECTAAKSLRESLEVVGFGILIADVHGKVLMANRAADSIMRRGDGLKCRHGKLVCDRPRESSALHDAIRAAAQPLRTPRPIPVDLFVSRGDQRALTVHVVPIPSVSAWNGFAPPSGAAALFVVDPQIHVDHVDGLATAYSLTMAERRVLREIVQCTGLVGTAEKLAIAIPTARTHLQHIFSKTNTNSQAELVRLALTSSLAPVSARNGDAEN